MCMSAAIEAAHPAQHLRLATATTPPYARMKHRRATLNPGSRLMLNPVQRHVFLDSLNM